MSIDSEIGKGDEFVPDWPGFGAVIIVISAGFIPEGPEEKPMLDSESKYNKGVSYAGEGGPDHVGVDETQSYVIDGLPMMSRMVVILTRRIPP